MEWIHEYNNTECITPVIKHISVKKRWLVLFNRNMNESDELNVNGSVVPVILNVVIANFEYSLLIFAVW